MRKCWFKFSNATFEFPGNKQIVLWFRGDYSLSWFKRRSVNKIYISFWFQVIDRLFGWRSYDVIVCHLIIDKVFAIRRYRLNIRNCIENGCSLICRWPMWTSMSTGNANTKTFSTCDYKNKIPAESKNLYFRLSNPNIAIALPVFQCENTTSDRMRSQYKKMLNFYLQKMESLGLNYSLCACGP